MNAVDTVTSKKIANASVFATMMIVGIHTLGHGWQLLDKGSPLWWLTAFGQYGLFSIAVPFFFICSGYFLAGHMEMQGWFKKELVKRLSTLAVPYLIWSVLFALLTIAIESTSGDGKFATVSFWVESLGFEITKYPKLGPLWYVRALLLFVVVSPAVLFALRGRRWAGIAFLVATYVFAVICHFVGRFWKDGGLVFTHCFNIFGFWYFCLGVCGRLWHLKLPQHGNGAALLVGIFLVFAGAWCNLKGILCTIPQSGRVVPILLFGLWGFVPEAKLPDWLTKTTFAIFLLHIPVYKVLGCILPIKVENAYQWGMKWGIGWGCSLALAVSITKFCPCVARFLFGGRV